MWVHASRHACRPGYPAAPMPLPWPQTALPILQIMASQRRTLSVPLMWAKSSWTVRRWASRWSAPLAPACQSTAVARITRLLASRSHGKTLWPQTSLQDFKTQVQFCGAGRR